MAISPGVKTERTGWRDAGLSDRHRAWGYNCPAFDLDFLMVEYDQARACGLVEYKQENAPLPDYSTANYRALIDLANRAVVPAFSVRYAADYSWFIVTGLNELAREWFTGDAKISEPEYVRFLYRIRRRKMPALPFDGQSELSHDPAKDAIHA